MAHKCNHCPWETAEPDENISGPLASWHVYEDHPEVWKRIIGDRPPRDPDPRIPAIREWLASRN